MFYLETKVQLIFKRSCLAKHMINFIFGEFNEPLNPPCEKNQSSTPIYGTDIAYYILLYVV